MSLDLPAVRFRDVESVHTVTINSIERVVRVPADGQLLTRIMALHAMIYCERLFYLEEVEEIRVADRNVYDGRRFHEQLPDYVEMTSYVLESGELGIQGKVDVVRTENGEWIPFEYKKGHSQLECDGTVRAWPSDEIQLGAYALLLEEHFGRSISTGRVYYAGSHRTAVILVDDNLRHRVRSAIARAQQLRQTNHRPPVTTNERLCAKCSLAPVCLPEEERLVDNPHHSVAIAFPPDRDALDVHVTSPKATVRRVGGSIVIDERDGEKRDVPIHEIATITLHGHAQITTQTLHLCVSRGIQIHWMTTGGRYIGTVGNAAGGVQRRLRQYEGLADAETCLKLAIAVARAKVESQLRYILRLSRGKDRSPIENELETMREGLRKGGRAETLEELRGWGGLAGKAYFSCVGYLTRNDDTGMVFEGRNRRPPKDPANALLSFLYGLLYRDCVKAILIVGLDPCIGFFHQPRSSAYPLALDLMELFRVSLCDTILLGSVHRRQWIESEDFVRAGKQCWLTDSGRKKAIALYERRKQDTWKHPVIGYSLTYDRAMELEVRLLEKEWSGTPGLFALNRIR